MHFYYIDEAGCTGADIENEDQPIFVLGGISVRDEGWVQTQTELSKIISLYFDSAVPADFELHGSELLSPNGEGPFAGHTIERRLSLTRQVLNLIAERNHHVHLIALKKSEMRVLNCESELCFNPKVPYLCAFDYLITYINDHVRNRLGSTARGMIILDKKDQFHDAIEKIAHNRRFEGAATHRVKWVVEFSYPVDSCKNPMIQMSDLVVICTRRFFEIEHGYRETWPVEVKRFYAECYGNIHNRIVKKDLVSRQGRGVDSLNEFIAGARCQAVGQWRRRYGI